MSAAITATAHCLACPWSAGPGGWAAVDQQAGKHVRRGHPVTTMAVPATATEGTRP